MRSDTNENPHKISAKGRSLIQKYHTWMGLHKQLQRHECSHNKILLHLLRKAAYLPVSVAVFDIIIFFFGVIREENFIVFPFTKLLAMFVKQHSSRQLWSHKRRELHSFSIHKASSNIGLWSNKRVKLLPPMFAYAPTLGYCKVYNHAGFMPIEEVWSCNL